MSTVVPIKGTREAPKSQRSTMETLIVSVDQVNQWRVPAFQRPVRVNAKVLGIAAELKQGSICLTGVITLGKIGRDPTLWIVDGQHRLEAFRHSEIGEVIADVRIVHFDDMAEMAEEFVRLNSALVRMRPDDILRGLEPTTPSLQAIRKACPFVGYDQIRRNSNSSILGMSTVLRCWSGSSTETPTKGTNISLIQIAERLDTDDIEKLTRFLNLAQSAWGRDPEYYRLWGTLNLTLCMWLWRRLVTNPPGGAKRSVILTPAQFKQCLMSVSANRDYLDWLLGRVLEDRDRSPCYARLKAIFVKRLMEEQHDGKRPAILQPAWASN